MLIKSCCRRRKPRESKGKQVVVFVPQEKLGWFYLLNKEMLTLLTWLHPGSCCADIFLVGQQLFSYLLSFLFLYLETVRFLGYSHTSVGRGLSNLTSLEMRNRIFPLYQVGLTIYLFDLHVPFISVSSVRSFK